MYNYSTSKSVNSSNPLVVSFDITSGVKWYSLGINPNLGYKDTTHELKVYRNSLETIDSSDVESESDSSSSSNYTTVYNHLNNFLGAKSLIQQDFIISTQEYNVKISDEGLSFYLGDLTLPTDFGDLDLHYSCYTTSLTLTDKKDLVFFINELYYYKSFMEVIPVVCYFIEEDEDNSKDEDKEANEINEGNNNKKENEIITIITLNNLGGLTLLNLDYAIKLDTDKTNVTTIASIKNNKIILCDYLINKDYDKVRFVISDYGRIISHSIHPINSEKAYSDSNIHVFDSKNIKDNVFVKFSTDNALGISNITANF